MNWKRFLKPDRRKIVIFVVLLIIFIVGNLVVYAGPESSSMKGIPFVYFINGCIGKPGSPCYDNYFDLKNFIIDAIFSFVFSFMISYLIIWIYDKLKKKK
jgi:SNF family Na+-dependent transporter